VSALERTINDLVIANRILAHHAVFDEYGHVSVRHPHDPGRFLLARDCVAAAVKPRDIVELALDGDPAAEEGRQLCPERFVHGAIYEARPDLRAIVCAASEDVQPFTMTAALFRAVIGPVGDMGVEAPLWDIADTYGGKTDLSISTLERGRDLARCLGPHRVVLTRGVGFVATGRTLNDAVRLSVYVPKNARSLARSLMFGQIRGLSQGETMARLAIDPESNAMRRGWEFWAREAGCQEWL
jgi:HCOMODA/2-hydroxy-3-carboxy-muconic semialdehyde decarboxylase